MTESIPAKNTRILEHAARLARSSGKPVSCTVTAEDGRPLGVVVTHKDGRVQLFQKADSEHVPITGNHPTDESENKWED